MKYKKYWRKTVLRGDWGNILLNEIEKANPKNFLEIGVYCGVTARNICELLNKVNSGNFKYYGCDLFGGTKTSTDDEIEPYKEENSLHFSNPLKRIYYDFIMKEKINSYESVKKFLKKFKDKVTLIKGDSRVTLKQVPLNDIDYVFVDGGHSYTTVKSDLEYLINGLRSGSKILCDDYYGIYKIDSVRKAIDDTLKMHGIKASQKHERFAFFEI